MTRKFKSNYYRIAQINKSPLCVHLVLRSSLDNALIKLSEAHSLFHYSVIHMIAVFYRCQHKPSFTGDSQFAQAAHFLLSDWQEV